MAAININNVSGSNGHNLLASATSIVTDADPDDQVIMYSSQTSPQSESSGAPYQVHQSRQQVYVQNTDDKTGRSDAVRSNNTGKPNSTGNHQYLHHHFSNSNMLNYDFVSIKSKIGVEFRRYALDSENFLLPINNDDNLAKAISSAKPITLHNTNCNNNQPATIKRPYLKLYIEKKGIFLNYYNGNLTGKYKKNQHFKGFSNLILPTNEQSLRPSIGMPEDFRQVSSIIDVDIVPETCRRVRIVKHGSDRPLGFYIRDGTYKRMNAQGQLELVTGIFISRLVPGGLAESTGLLAVNDEVLEVNGIQVTHGKTLDQVTDMMVANSSNLIITIRPGKINNFMS